ncbi:MAG: serine hydroxymethyltransferase [Bdellovibrionota bacterium]
MNDLHFTQKLTDNDPELWQSFEREFSRQRDHLELIASENYTSAAVIQAMGSILTNKYAEGYPGKRYYGGCEYVDEVENLARNRAAELFKVGDFIPHVNVQSHAGAQANQAVFLALLQPGDKYLACSLSHGGHLTHGSPVNLSGKWFQPVHYTVNRETKRIDMNEVRDLALKEKPKLIIAGYSSYTRVLDFKAFRDIADEVGAKLMVDMAHFSGIVAAKKHPSPFPHAHVVTSTTHKTLRGPRSGMIMCHPEFAKAIDSAVFPGFQGGPLMHVIAGKAVTFKEALEPAFVTYIEQVLKNSQALSNTLTSLGYRMVSGGTDNHICVMDLSNKEITGKEAETLLDHAGLNANRNTIPYDTKSPMVTSGVRLGTPALTSRGMKEAEMQEVASFIDEAIQNKANEEKILSLKKKVKDFAVRFPIYTGPLAR